MIYLNFIKIQMDDAEREKTDIDTQKQNIK